MENVWQVSSRPGRSVLLAYQKLTLLEITLVINWSRGHSSAVSKEGVSWVQGVQRVERTYSQRTR